MLALHLLQNCMVYVNTLMVQRVLGEPIWLKHMGVTEQRALTPLFWGHVNPRPTAEIRPSRVQGDGARRDRTQLPL
jgi:hypothetical protein